MACPYVDCSDASELPMGTESCPICRRLVKPCLHCSNWNRAFANYCRTCGRPLPEPVGEWIGFKGGPQRLGLNRWPQRWPLRESHIETILELRLGDSCRSLLSYDRHLIAVSGNGMVTIVDVTRGAGEAVHLHTEGPITAEPCVSRGVLYLATSGRLSAYVLGGLEQEEPRLEPRWEVRVQGIPIQALLVLEDRLYVNVLLPDRRREVRRISGIESDRPGDTELLLTALRPSWLAANPPSRRVFCLAEEGGDLRVHWTDHGATSGPAVMKRSVAGALLPFVDAVPIAVMGAKVFAVLGASEKLCRIDAHEGVLELATQGDARNFALSSVRDGLLVDAGGLVFLGAQRREELNPSEQVKCAPVILKDCAAAVGLKDGRIRVYDLQNLPLNHEKRVSTDMEEVTSLISFRSYIAAGDAVGTVKVFELVRRA